MMNIDFTEIEKLHSMLNEADIPHTFTPWFDGMQIRIYADSKLTDELDDVIIYSGSNGVEVGLLETFYLSNGVGWETAEQVFEGWKKKYGNYHWGLTNS